MKKYGLWVIACASLLMTACNSGGNVENASETTEEITTESTEVETTEAETETETEEPTTEADTENAEPLYTELYHVTGIWYIDGNWDSASIAFDDEDYSFVAYYASGAQETEGYYICGREGNRFTLTLYENDGDAPYLNLFAEDGVTNEEIYDLYSESGVHYVWLYGLDGLGADGMGEDSKLFFTWELKYEEDAEYAVISAYDDTDALCWQYETEHTPVAQLDSNQEIGKTYYGYLIVSGGKIYCFDKNNTEEPSILWVNEDFQGASIAYDFDDAGNLYICGYYGPYLMKINADGETEYRVEKAEAYTDYFYPSDVIYTDGKVEISFDSNEGTLVYDESQASWSPAF